MPEPFAPFFDLPPEYCDYASCRVVILPVPFERTTSWGRGTEAGPEAVLAASGQVELFEEMTRSEPFRLGIATLPYLRPVSQELPSALEEIREAAHPHFAAGKFLITLGGEHSLTIAPVRAASAVHEPLGVVQLDAHADLRDSYDGTPHSHACVVRRVMEAEIPTLALGVRALDREEAVLIGNRELPTVWGWELATLRRRLPELLAALPEKVYVTFDVDFLDPSIMPATGTPVPGGGLWYPTLDLLREIFCRKQVVGMDIVELAPDPHHRHCDFLVASLLYKCVGFLAENLAKLGPRC